MISSEKNSAGPTSTAASPITRQRASPCSVCPGCSWSHCSRCLCAFSIITMAASTIAPMAIAMPPSDITLALMPCCCITMKAASTPSGSETMATSALRRWNRNAKQISATTANSSSSLVERFCTARSIRPERSYTGTISTPAGSPRCNSANRALTAAMVCSAFLPERITITPPTDSPSPSSSPMPRRISGPSWMRATSPSRTETPASVVRSGMARKSSSVFR